ncbi:hypothetical protein IGS59_10400 [Janthinobacterium sp. GW460P]|uniref:hypothetical protein n=1 Tax=unclassified Janthinobacterium TaxID=2610881 RepID=UPI00111C7AA3|nr:MULTISPECIES: hypothetical protein [unclassified Janthinobacterium]MCC7702651.1 hypothetical protein [Janthinobacterium sp. GW460P]MCC7708159.1 hypothetical protein [Janthinobacterium sp. GW460W]
MTDSMTGFRQRSLDEGILNGSRVFSRLVAIHVEIRHKITANRPHAMSAAATASLNGREMPPKYAGFQLDAHGQRSHHGAGSSVNGHADNSS